MPAHFLRRRALSPASIVKAVAITAAVAMIMSLVGANPASAHQLEAQQAGFEDVGSGHVFSSEIDWLAAEGITRGCNPQDGNTRFCPDDQVTRGQMAAFLVRAMGLSAAAGSFTDTGGHVFEADIAALANAGITRGCNPQDGNTRFCPDDQVTRGQMAAFLVRALGLGAADGSFTDTTGHIFEGDIAAFASAGITRGCNPPDNTRFCPDDQVTRGQMAAFLYRALSSGTTNDSDPDDEADTPAPSKMISAGWAAHTCGIAGGVAYCWGDGDLGKLGDGTWDDSNVPLAVGGLLAGKTMTDIGAGQSHTCAVANGAAYCWGRGFEGQLGLGGSGAPRSVPEQVAGALAGKTVTAISAGVEHTCAIADDAAYCWGSGEDGRLGDGEQNSVDRPVLVGGALSGRTVTAISAGGYHTCAIADGGAYCWGYGEDGQLGDGTRDDGNVPVAVVGVLAGKTVTDISTGRYHTCAVADGAAYCWGYGVFGQLGIGTEDDSTVPVAVVGALAGKTVAAISAGGYHTCAIADGAAYCWGDGEDGQLGNGSENGSNVPVAAAAALASKAVTDVSAGGLHSCAVAGDDAYCWGEGEFGQLGAGANTASSTPVAVTWPTP